LNTIKDILILLLDSDDLRIRKKCYQIVKILIKKFSNKLSQKFVEKVYRNCSAEKIKVLKVFTLDYLIYL